MTQQIPPPPPWPEWPFDCAVTGLVDVDDEPIDFTPVPRQRKRRNGWSELAQRAFIGARGVRLRPPLGARGRDERAIRL